MRPASCREFIEDLIGRSTRKATRPGDSASEVEDLWYMIYKDDEGEVHTVKGSTQAIRRSLREGLLGDASNVRACRTKLGPFEPVRSHPEFRDLVVPVGPTPAEAAEQVPLPGEIELVPHIKLGPTNPPTNEWLRWLVLAIVSVVTGVVAFLLLKR